ncbi:hypothetical protein Hanom_Chr12g01152881 [Helianthus anomalus]
MREILSKLVASLMTISGKGFLFSLESSLFLFFGYWVFRFDVPSGVLVMISLTSFFIQTCDC